MKKFNLSDEIIEHRFEHLLNVVDVKEFIKKLKEERPMGFFMNEWIDKLAGKKLK